MFTKYTDIDLPKNYSGSRFKQSLADTRMKTHRAQDISASAPSIKTAVSPSFQDIIDKTAKAAAVDEQPEEIYVNNDIIEEITDQEAEKSDEKAEDAFNSLPIEAQPRHNEESNNDFFSLFKASGLGKLLSNKSKDDFLLIALIALLASDGSGDNLDAIVLLALLLLYS